MIPGIIRRFTIEFKHFRMVSQQARYMLLSYALYLTAYPLIATFMNSYLWRSGGDLWGIILYNTGWISGLPIGFLLNGILLKKIHVLRLYFAGLLLQAIIPCMIVFVPNIGLSGVLLFGLVYGVGSGLFWGNKSYLDLQLTRGTNRMYYNSLGIIIDLIANIIVPLAAGWFIVYVHSVYVPESFIAYKVIMSVACILLFLSGLAVQSTHVKNIRVTGMFIRNPKTVWYSLRAFNILHNIQVGVTLVLSSVVILVLVGQEGILGTLQACTAGLSAVALYIIGRKSTTSQAWKFIGIGSTIFLLGTGILAWTYNWIGGIMYTMGITIAWAFQWSPANTVSMDLMDSIEKDAEKQYAYIFDNEIFYNLGRAIGISIVTVLVLVGNEYATIRWSPLIVGAIQIPLAWYIYKIVKNIQLPASPASPSASTTGRASRKTG